jgi:hypothetical protein
MTEVKVDEVTKAIGATKTINGKKESKKLTVKDLKKLNVKDLENLNAKLEGEIEGLKQIVANQNGTINYLVGKINHMVDTGNMIMTEINTKYANNQ